MLCFPSEKESTLKGKNLLPLGANSFLLELTHFQKELGIQYKQTEIYKRCLPCIKMAEKSAKCIKLLKIKHGVEKICLQ